jgi:hypothetical protein
MQIKRTQVSAPFGGARGQGCSAVCNSNPEVGCDNGPFIMRITLLPPHVSGPLHVE